MTKTRSHVRCVSRASVFGRFLRRAFANTRGGAAVEFGVIVPLLALMVTAVSDIGFGIYWKMQLEDAAQAGVVWAIRNGFDPNGISSAVANATNNSNITATPAPVQYCGCANGSSVSTATCGGFCPDGAQVGTYVTVSVRATYNTTLSYSVVPNTYNFATQSTARLQ